MRRDLLEMFLDDAGGFEKCLGLQYASHDAGIDDSIRNPDPLLDRTGPITDRLFGLSLADDYDYGGKLGARIKTGGFAGEAMPHPQISLQESVFGFSCRGDGVLQRCNGYDPVASEERRSKVKTQSTTIYDGMGPRYLILPTQDDVNIHLKSKTPCDVLQDIVVEGFDVAQREKLRCKKRSWGKSGQQKWEDIFRILFPDCNEIPDPYYNHNFDGVAPDPVTAGKKRPLDVGSAFTDRLPQELEEDKRKKVMQVVETLVIKVLQQPLVAKDTKSGEALVKTPEDERSCNEQQTTGSNARSISRDSLSPTQALRPAATLQVEFDSQDHRSQSISDGALIDIPEDEGNAWLPTEFYDVDFGDESNLQTWPGWNSAFVEGNGYEWAAVGATAFRVPCWNQTLDYTPAQGDGNLS
ncbi:hypothetical protein CGCA056_v011815 [Colletotrichum aenigma]|uniref:uncharacterized protein n=1 Tax=Colletotrichum aenigma TaxID=1215731 RepID=UPI001873162C|nr:uncharacterized protein CGCA056_v011815 [Colletotrichum aenigma]KAF5512529.1 hypothetical protein CGCA056_v011815 [Colletotrichum aenigma]